MHLKIPHTFSKQEALKRVKAALEEARPQFKDRVEIHEEQWKDDTLSFSFTAEGQNVSGTLVIEEAQFVLDAKLPFMLRLFESRIQAEIEKQVKRLK
jgi:hypothetical protein